MRLCETQECGNTSSGDQTPVLHSSNKLKPKRRSSKSFVIGMKQTAVACFRFRKTKTPGYCGGREISPARFCDTWRASNVLGSSPFAPFDIMISA